MASSDPRQLALEILLSFEDQGGRLDQYISSVSGKVSPQNKSLLRELVFGAVRFARLYDWMTRDWLKQPVAAPLAVTLRLACHQLFALDRIPPHAVGDRMVELMRGPFRRWRGVVNAVIRKLTRLRLLERQQLTDHLETLGGELVELSAELNAGLDAGLNAERPMPGPLGRLASSHWPSDLAIRYSVPSSLVEELEQGANSQADCSLEQLHQGLLWLNQVPPLTTRHRDMAQLGIDDPEGLLRRRDQWSWWAHPGPVLRQLVGAGVAVVQDYSQGLAIELAAPQPGELVLDCCAAPGGKSALLQDLGCQVVSAELQQHKIAELVTVNQRTIRMDATHPALAPEFDLVVCDVPCSNSGVFARRPEAQRRYQKDALVSLAEIQQKIIQAAACLVKPGGRLLYSTCSLSPSENHQIAASLRGWQIHREVTHWPSPWMAGGYAAVLLRDL